MIKEEWRIIENTKEAYEASNTGFIRRTKPYRNITYAGRILNPAHDKNGYPQVTIWIDGKKRAYLVHRIIARTYMGERKDGYTVNHKDGNKLNNNIENLEYVTNAENIEHAIKNGLRADQRGTKNPQSKLTDDDVYKIRSLLDTITQKEIGKMFGVKKPAIADIKHGRTWAHLK